MHRPKTVNGYPFPGLDVSGRGRSVAGLIRQLSRPDGTLRDQVWSVVTPGPCVCCGILLERGDDALWMWGGDTLDPAAICRLCLLVLRDGAHPDWAPGRVRQPALDELHVARAAEEARLDAEHLSRQLAAAEKNIERLLATQSICGWYPGRRCERRCQTPATHALLRCHRPYLAVVRLTCEAHIRPQITPRDRGGIPQPFVLVEVRQLDDPHGPGVTLPVVTEVRAAAERAVERYCYPRRTQVIEAVREPDGTRPRWHIVADWDDAVVGDAEHAWTLRPGRIAMSSPCPGCDEDTGRPRELRWTTTAERRVAVAICRWRHAEVLLDEVLEPAA